MNHRLRLIFGLFVIALLSNCVGGDKNNRHSKGKGGVYLGGVFRMNEIEDFRNLYPLSLTDQPSFHIVTQIYEGLLRFSQKDLSMMPCLAEKWEVTDSAKIYTFHLRKNVKFQDNLCFEGGKGREFTAKDVKYCFDRICENDPSNNAFFVFKDRVLGANEYFESTKAKQPFPGGVSGVKVIDDYTIQITLTHPYAAFLNVLSSYFTDIYPKEAVDKYGIEMRTKTVGTGPFKVKEVKEGEAVILTRNEKYWGVDEFGNQLPYLDAIKFSFVKEKKSELLEFKKNNLEMVYQLPTEMIDEVMGDVNGPKSDYVKFQLQINPALQIQYYGFQHLSEAFNNKLVRQAFNYAIDRQKIVDFTMQGEGIPATHGIVPPSTPGYNTEAVRGYDYNPEKAKKLLAEAGYPNGKGFSKITLQLNSGGGLRSQVAEVIQKMIKENLNIDVELNIMPLAQSLENIETGKALFWRAGWIADYPDAETFLNIFYGPNVPAKLADRSTINTTRYKSKKFDDLLDAARLEIDFSKRNDLYRQADQQAMDDAAILPLYYDENYRLLQPYVMNFDQNGMDFRDLTRVYFADEDKQSHKKHAPGGNASDSTASIAKPEKHQ